MGAEAHPRYDAASFARRASGRLDPCPQNVESDLADDLNKSYRFRTCKDARRRWKEFALAGWLDPKTASRFKSCGETSWVVREKSTDRFFVQCTTCKLRWCPICGLRKALKIRDSLTTALSSSPGASWQFVTLTQKHSAAPLLDQVKNLRRAYRRLRQRGLWKKCVGRAVAVVEVTRNAERNEWHPHLHVIAETTFLDWSKLRKDWCKVTSGSNIIDVQKLRSTEKALEYVCNYLGQPATETVLADFALMREWVESLNYSRLVIRSGRWEKPTPIMKERHQHESIMPLDACLRRAACGDPEALAILARLESSRSKSFTSLESHRVTASTLCVSVAAADNDRFLASYLADSS